MKRNQNRDRNQYLPPKVSQDGFSEMSVAESADATPRPGGSDSSQHVPQPEPVTVVLNAAAPRGFVFLCNNLTLSECFARQLFGLPSHHWSSVSSIVPVSASDDPPTLIFLLNTSRPQLVFGVFVADDVPVYNAVSDAWEGRFPAQCRIRRVFDGVASIASKLDVGKVDEAQAAQLCEALGTSLRHVYDLAGGRRVKSGAFPSKDATAGGHSGEDSRGDGAEATAASTVDASLPGYLLHCTPDSWKTCVKDGMLAATRRHLDWLSVGLAPGRTQLFVLDKSSGLISGPYVCTGAVTVNLSSDAHAPSNDPTSPFSFPTRIPFSATTVLPFVALPAALSTFVGVGALNHDQVAVLNGVVAGKPLLPENVTVMSTRHKVWQKRRYQGRHSSSPRVPVWRPRSGPSELPGLVSSLAAVNVTAPS
jgi:hypothetical protein